jgi:hypothetical protein
MTSIQNVLDRQRVEVVTISPSDTVKDAADRIGPHCRAGRNKRCGSRRPMTPRQFNFMRRSLHGPSADVSGRASRLVGTPDPTRRRPGWPDPLDRPPPDLMNYPIVTAGLVLGPRGVGTMGAMLLVGKLIGKVDTRALLGVGLGLSPGRSMR